MAELAVITVINSDGSHGSLATAQELCQEGTTPLASCMRVDVLFGNCMTQSLLTATKLVTSFLETWEQFAQLDRDAVNRLCRLAAATDPEVNAAATRALFTNLIETLNDSFDPRAARVYDLVMAQVVDFFRREESGKGIDEALNSFGLENEASLLARRARLRSSETRIVPESIQKAIFLSRVTIGADVAVTSVLMRRFRDLAPHVEQVFIGNREKLSEVFGSEVGLRIRDLKYSRGGDVITRLSSWLALQEEINEEINNLDQSQYVVVDPDSRLTQLGLLPLTQNNQSYFHFESRSYGPKTCSTLATLASEWFSEVFEDLDESRSATFPSIAVDGKFVELATFLINRIRLSPSDRVVVVSLGVGGNPEKRISQQFEAMLLEHLAGQAKLIIDEGADELESAIVKAHADMLEGSGKVVRRMEESDALSTTIDGHTEVLIWNGGIGSLSALIGKSDLYVGYDSAGQHIAAAQKIPLLTLFVNNSTPRFAQRWRPSGEGPIEVLLVNGKDRELLNEAELFEQAVECLRALLSPQSSSVT